MATGSTASQPVGKPDRHLIFIVSQPRAGSTLLQSILAGIDEVHTTAEPWLMLHPVYALREAGHTADYDATVAHRALLDFLGALPDGEAVYYSALRQMALDLYGRACRQAGKSWFLDKTPRYYKILPELARIFPGARFIILLRNPAAVLSSISRTWVEGNWTRFDYFRDDLLAAPRLMTEFISNFAEQAIVVQYETLVLSPEPTIQSICNWLGLPFSSRLLNYGDRPPLSGRYGDPVGIGKHDRPSTDSLDAWLTHAEDPQIHHLLRSYVVALGPDQVARMGYVSEELLGALDAVPRRRGKPSVTWDQLLKSEKTFADGLALILSEARQKRRPGHTIKQIARLLSNRL